MTLKKFIGSEDKFFLHKNFFITGKIFLVELRLEICPKY